VGGSSAGLLAVGGVKAFPWQEIEVPIKTTISKMAARLAMTLRDFFALMLITSRSIFPKII
jgi:hypothetical protein